MIKLIPIAKPVRYTIKSGGRDCADLNDLLKSFNVDDLNKIDIKQLHEWAKRRCANVPSIAEKLSKQPSELEYYQIFYQHDFKDLHAALIWLKGSNKYKDSFDFLFHYLVKQGDGQTIEDLLNDTKVKEIKEHKEFFIDMARDIIDSKPSSDSAEFKVLKVLSRFGIDNAEDYIKGFSTFTNGNYYKFSNLEYSNLLLYILTCEGNIKERVKKKYGSTYDSLNDNLKSFCEAVCYCNMTYNDGEKSSSTSYTYHYRKAIEQLEEKSPLNNERQFLCALLHGALGDKQERYKELNDLSDKGYDFANLCLGRAHKHLPKELVDYVNNSYKISYDHKPSDPLLDFLKEYFKHFLDEEYFHGKLEDL